MDAVEKFIADNLPTLMSIAKVKARTAEIGGSWSLMEINSYHETPRNVEFSLIIINEAEKCLLIRGKISREGAKISNIEVRDL